jgi:hypothetical protein
MMARILPDIALRRGAEGSLSWLARFGGMLLVIAGIPAVLGMMLGLLTGPPRKR